MSLTWIAAISLLTIILVLLLAPALDVRLTRRVVNPIIIAALLLAVALALSNWGALLDDIEGQRVLFVFSGILVAASLFLVAFAAARFALGDGPAPLTSAASSSIDESRSGI